jgi:hypothetical protein
MDRATPPVAILVRFHLGVVVVDVDRLIHDSFVAPGEAMFNGRNQVAGYRLQQLPTEGFLSSDLVASPVLTCNP